MAEPTNGVKISLSNIVIISSSALSILVIIFGSFSLYIVSRTQFEDQQKTMSTQLAIIQSKLNDLAKANNDLSNRVTKMEESARFVEQGVTDLQKAINKR